MIIHWKQENGSAATYQTLNAALQHTLVQRKDLAEKICYKDGDVKQSPHNVRPLFSGTARTFKEVKKLANHRIYLVKRPGRLLNFWTFRVGAYSRWAFIRGWAHTKFSPFSVSKEFILQQNNN